MLTPILLLATGIVVPPLQHAAPVRPPAPPPAPVYRAPARAYHPLPAPPHLEPPHVMPPAPVAPPVHLAPTPVLQAQATIPNPFGWRRWAWNHGTIWQPVSYYRGGGFWGPWGLWTTPPLTQPYPSYEASPLSPGAKLLYDYGLTQTPCGAQNLVVIRGPGDAVICAYPTARLIPGSYRVDPGTLTLTPQ
jgi:hypothetical protein